MHVWRPSKVTSEPSVSCIPFSLVSSAFHLLLSWSHQLRAVDSLLSSLCQWTKVRPSSLFGATPYALSMVSVSITNLPLSPHISLPAEIIQLPHWITLSLALGNDLQVENLELYKENLALIAYGHFDHWGLFGWAKIS